VVIGDATGSASSTWTPRTANEDRLAAAHAALTDAVGKVATSEDWQNLQHTSGSFTGYSPNNQLLLAFGRSWLTIGGHRCNGCWRLEDAPRRGARAAVTSTLTQVTATGHWSSCRRFRYDPRGKCSG
jgi:hypothetical protein